MYSQTEDDTTRRDINYSIYLENDSKLETIVLASVVSSVEMDDKSGVPDEMLKLLNEDCFFNSQTREMYNVIKRCRKEGKTACMANVFLYYKEPVVGGDFLGDIVTSSTVPLIKEHCGKLISLRQLRDMVKYINKVYATLHSDEGDIGDRVQKAQSYLSQTFVDEKEKSGGDYVKNILAGYFEKKQEKMNGINTGISTGFKDLDEQCGGMQGGDLIVVAGPSGMGKTAFALTVLDNVQRQELFGAIFSLEMDNEEVLDRLISGRTKLGGEEISNSTLRVGKNLSMRNLESILKVADSETLQNIYIDDGYDSDYATVCSRARKLKADGKLNFLLVDYIQLQVQDEHKAREELSNITRAYKKLAGELDIPIMILSQLNKRDFSDGVRPNKGHLKGSGSIESDAVLILFPFRPFAVSNDPNLDPSEASLIIGKSRHFNGYDIPLHFCTSTTMFTDKQEVEDPDF